MKEGQRYWLARGYAYLTCLCILATNSLQTSHAAQVPYVDYCPLDFAVVNVEWDAGLKKLFRSPSRRRSQVRILAEAEVEAGDTEVDTRQLRKRILGDTSSSSSNDKIFQARRCACASDYRGGETTYCLVRNNENLCRIPQSKEDPIECYKTTSAEIFSRNAWPVAILWIAAMILYMIGTEGGRLGVRFLISKLCCCKIIMSRSNQHIVNEIVARETDARRRFQRAAVNRASRRLEQDPVTYILKTKEYKRGRISFNGSSSPGSPGDLTLPMTPESTKSFEITGTDGECNFDMTCLPCVKGDDNDDAFSDNDEVTCTICIMDIEEGERVGVLECNHLFHSDCLKSWIKRKNVCPLCQSPDIAREKDSPTVTTPNNSDNNVENDGDNDNNNGESNVSQENRVVRSTGMFFDANDTRNRRRRHMGLGVNTNSNQSVQRDLFQVNGGGHGGSGNGRMIMVGDPVATVRVQVNPNTSTSNRGFNFNGRETPVQRRDRLNNMRRAWNPN